MAQRLWSSLHGREERRSGQEARGPPGRELGRDERPVRRDRCPLPGEPGRVNLGRVTTPPTGLRERRIDLAVRWWPGWVVANLLVFGAALRRQLEVVDDPCDRCVSVFRLDAVQQRALVDAGGSVDQYRFLVAVVIVGFAAVAGWLGWILVRRSHPEVLPVALGYLLVSVAATRWIEDAATLNTGVFAPLARLVLIANALAIPVLFAIFPDGEWRPRWSRWVVAGIGTWATATYLSPMADQLARGMDPVAAIDATVFLAGVALSFGWQVARYRVSDESDRRSIRWVVAALGVVLVVFVPLVLAVRSDVRTDPRWHVLSVGIAVAAFALLLGVIAMAVVRGRLWDVDVAVNRLIVYGGLTLSILVAYGAVVAVISRTATVGVSPGALAAALVVALAVQPLRSRLQRLAEQLLYGSEPPTTELFGPIGQVGVADPGAILTSTAGLIATSLRVSWVSLALEVDGAEPFVAIVGQPVDGAPTLEHPLRVDGLDVGRLVVGVRRGQRRFTRRDRQLVSAVAGQAALTAAMMRLAVALQRSRAAIVSAQEDERRRLRQELHDELGPTLASIGHRLEQVLDSLPNVAGSSASIISAANDDVHQAFDEVRRLARGLRPTILDRLNLDGALEAMAVDLGLDFRTCGEAPDDLAPAVEVAFYRIGAEALVNAKHHGAARTVRLTVTTEKHLVMMSIEDDGVGLPIPAAEGVGMQSMRDRAEELGGTLTIGPGSTLGGVKVTATIPGGAVLA